MEDFVPIATLIFTNAIASRVVDQFFGKGDIIPMTLLSLAQKKLMNVQQKCPSYGVQVKILDRQNTKQNKHKMRNLAKVDFTEKQVENLSLPTIMHMTLTFLTKDKVKQEYLLRNL